MVTWETKCGEFISRINSPFLPHCLTSGVLFPHYLALLALAQNFGVSVAGAQLSGRMLQDPRLSEAAGAAEVFFTSVFTVDVGVCLFSYWMRPFLRNPWSVPTSLRSCVEVLGIGREEVRNCWLGSGNSLL